MNTHRPFYRIVAFTLSGILFWNPLISAAAELAVDKSGGGNTAIVQANNGAPIVNIATPSGKGLSHNQFIHYNVGPNGLILNNSHGPANSTIAGGTIDGNPNLTNGAAKVILNEVTSTNPSQLQGYTEVAGAQAHVIVANPNGITCDGCGFINTPRATLTTGKPVIEGGELKRYDVEQGQITFEGQDINVTNVDQFEIITRSAQLNAKLHGKHITAVLGANDVDAQTLEATPKEGTGDKPRLALDSSALGGMYANSIRLIGTEAGVGVNIPGELAASGGDIRIDVGGKLMLASVAAAQELALKAQEIELENAQAGHKARIEATGTLTSTGTLVSPRIEIVSVGFINTGSIFATNSLGIQTNWSSNQGGSLVSQNLLSLTSDTLNNQDGEILARSLSLNLGKGPWINKGTLIAANDLTLVLSGLENHGTLGAGKTLVLDIAELLNQAGALLFAGEDMGLYVQNLTNLGDIQSGGNLFIARNSGAEMAEQFSNRSGTIQSGGDLTIFAKQIENVRDVFEVAETVQETLTFLWCEDCKFECSYWTGACSSRNDYYLYDKREALEVNASAPSWLLAGADMTLIGQAVSNTASVIGAQGNLLIQADTFANRGVLPGETHLQRQFSSRLQESGHQEMEKAVAELNALFAAGKSGNDMVLRSHDAGTVRVATLAAGEEAARAKLEALLAQNASEESIRIAEDQLQRAIRAGQKLEQLWGCADANGCIATVESLFNAYLNKYIRYDTLIKKPVFTPAENAAQYQGVVQAGGSIQIDAAKTIDNAIERAYFNYMSAGETANGLATPVSFNPQLSPETTRKFIDPLALAGLPTSGLFKNAAPDHPWLIGVSPHISSVATFGSDYLFALLGVSLEANQKRLGDALYEQWLVRQAILARLGQWLLDGFESEEAQYKALMDNAAIEAKALKLTLGVALTTEQIASLKRDIVWLVEKEVQGQKVLAPVLYLAQSADRIAPNGALIAAAGDVLLSGSQFNNMGTIKAENLIALIDGKIENSGLMQSKEMLALLAQAIENARGGILTGQDIVLQTEGDFINETSVTTHDATHHVRNQGYIDFVDSLARIEASNNVFIQAQGNLINQGGVIQAGGEVSLEAWENLILNSAEARQKSERKLPHLHVYEESITQHGAQVSAGGNLTLIAAQNLGVIGSSVHAGGDVQLIANAQIVLASAANEQHIEYHNRGNKQHDIVDRVTQQSATVTGNNITLVSGDDITLVSSQIQANHDATLSSVGDIHLLSASNERYDYHHREEQGFFGSSQTDTVYDSRLVSSQIQAAGDISLQSLGDITLVSSQLQAGGDIALLSAGTISLLAAYNEYFEQHIKQTSGLEFHPFLTGEILHVKKTLAKSNADHIAVPNLIEAGGSISIQSAGDQRYQRAQLRAGEELALISGGDIWFDATLDRHEHSKSKIYGDQYLNRSKNVGIVDETLRQNELIAKGQPIIEAAGQIHVQIRELPPDRQELIARIVGQVVETPQPTDVPDIDTDNLSPEEITKAIEAMAGSNPELAWLKQLNDRGDIDYERVKEVHKDWNRTFNGLTTFAAVVIVVVVTALTWGSASGAVAGAANSAGATGTTATAFAAGSTTTTVLSTGTVITTTTTIGWANAAVTASLYGAGSSAFIQGTTTGRVDWGQVGKSALVSGITAGLLNYPAFGDGMLSLNQLAGFSSSPILQSTGGFMDSTRLVSIIGRGVVNAGVSNLILGTDFKDGFIGSVVGDFATIGANKIGDYWGSGPNKNPFMQTIAHGGLGATAAWATGKDPWAGAIGGMSESILGNLIGKNFPDNKRGEAFYTGASMLVGGTIADFFGHDPVTAAYAAQNAAQNNFWLHKDEYDALIEAKSACEKSGGIGAACERYQQIRKESGALMAQRENAMREACGSGGNPQQCSAQWQDFSQASFHIENKYLELERYTHANAPNGDIYGLDGSQDYLAIKGSGLPYSHLWDNSAAEPAVNSAPAVDSFNETKDYVYGGYGAFGGDSDAPSVQSRYAIDFGPAYNQNLPVAWNIELGPTGVVVFDFVLDMTPVGTFADFRDANNWSDYAWVVLGVAPFGKAIDKVGDLANLAKKLEKGADGAKDAASAAKKRVGKYEVGTYDTSKARSTAGDGLDIHHVPQKNPAGQVIDGYNPANGPSIAVPRGEHARIPTTKGEYTGTARDLLSKDIRDLRNNTNASNKSLRELIDLNKKMYPEAFKK